MAKKHTTIHRIMYHVARFFVRPFAKIKYSFKTDKLPKTDGPVLMLCNHTTEADMIFAGLANPRHMYFVAGEHLLRNPVYGKLLNTLIGPIPLPKGAASLSAVREIMKRIANGDSICMFPEGKRSFHGETIPCGESIGKLVKHLKCTVVTYKIIGGYFTYPRWAKPNHRKGKVTGKLVSVYKPSDIDAMSVSEITKAINSDLYENAYDTQRQLMDKYKGKNLAEGLQYVLCMCPKCKSLNSIKTSGDNFKCEVCGLTGTADEFGFLRGDKLPYDNVHDWMRWVEPEFDAYVEKLSADIPVFECGNVSFYEMNEDYTNTPIGEGRAVVYKDRMEICGNTFVFSEIDYLSIMFGNKILFTYNNKYYGATGADLLAWECGRLFHIAHGDENDRTKEL